MSWPYLGMPAGKNRVTIEWTWISGSSGNLTFIACHDGGKRRLAVQRVEVQSLKPGRQTIDLALDLTEDITDLEVVCEARTVDCLKLSIDKVIVSTNVLPSHSRSAKSKAELANSTTMGSRKTGADASSHQG